MFIVGYSKRWLLVGLSGFSYEKLTELELFLAQITGAM